MGRGGTGTKPPPEDAAGVRAWAQRVVSHKAFDNIIMLLIFANAIIMGIVDYGVVDEEGNLKCDGSFRNSFVEYADVVFVYIFLIECILKITALGFACGEHAYLSDNWNRLDFLIVAVGVISLIFSPVPCSQSPPGGTIFKVLRTVRILRPLRSLSHSPNIRKLVSCLLGSIPALMNVVVLLLFVFCIWGILAVQFWGAEGSMHGRCRLTDRPVRLREGEGFDVDHMEVAKRYWANPEQEACLPYSEESEVDAEKTLSKSTSPWLKARHCVWPLDGRTSRLCNFRASGAYTCPPFDATGAEAVENMPASKAFPNRATGWCGSNYDWWGNARFNDSKTVEADWYNEDVNWGYTGFDDMLNSIVTIFQCVTLEGWTGVLYLVADGANDEVASLYFVGLTIFGSLFLLNMTLAVIYDSFMEQTAKMEEEAAKKEDAERLRAAIAGEDIDEEDKPSRLSLACSAFYTKNEWWLTFKIGPINALVETTIFRWTVILMIFLNTIILACDRYNQPQSEVQALEVINFLLTLGFVAEMVLKHIGKGIYGYWSDPMNVFDGVIVIVSVAEIAAAPPSFLDSSVTAGSGGGAISALRTFRLFRVLRLLSSVPSMVTLVKTVIRMVSSVANFGVLLMLFAYIFSMGGMQLFANKFHFDESGYPIAMGEPGYDDPSTIPRVNFDDIFGAFTCIFQALSGEDWNWLMYDARRASGITGLFFFLLVVVIGDWIVINLFLAVLLDGFDATRDDEKDDIKEKYIEKMNNPLDPEETVHNALFCFPKTSPFRVSVRKITKDKRFDNTILFLIIVSSVCLALDSPLKDPDGTLAQAMLVIDIVLTIIFVVEFVMKIIAEGFYFGRTSYIKHPENGWWNVLDISIVIISVVSLAARDQMAKYKFLRALRALRALRPLRMISRNPGMKQVVNALLQALPAAMNAMALLFLFYLIFGILAVSFFKGAQYACSNDGGMIGYVDADHGGVPDYNASFSAAANANITEAIVNPQSFAALQKQYADDPFAAAWIDPAQTGVEGYNGTTSRAVCEWIASQQQFQGAGLAWDFSGYLAPGGAQNFDNIIHAMLVLFEMATTEGWMNIMFSIVDSRGVDMQPKLDYNRGWYVFGFAFILVGAFFMLNLFVGVVIDTFTKLKDMSDGSILQTAEQLQWVKVQKMMARVRAHRKKRKPCPRNPLRALCWLLSSESNVDNPPPALLFDSFIMFVIVANTILMAASHFGQSDKVRNDLEIANIVCAMIFTAEAFIKIMGLGDRYFKDNWDRFDFSVVVATNTGLLLQYVFDVQVGPAAAAVRAVRIIRILRLVNKMKTLKLLFSAMFSALPALFNVSALLFLMYFIFAVLGNQLFATVALADNLSHHANFQSFGKSLMTVTRSSTGEVWNGIMYDVINRPDGCDPEPKYDLDVCAYNGGKYGCTPINGCGTSMGFAYFILFSWIVTFVFVNLFIAVILDGFEKSKEEQEDTGKHGLSQEEFDDFCSLWVKYDKELDWFVSEQEMYEIIARMPEPLGLGLDKALPMEQMKKSVAKYAIMKRQSANKNQPFHFEDVAEAVARYVVNERRKMAGEPLQEAPGTQSSSALATKPPASGTVAANVRVLV